MKRMLMILICCGALGFAQEPAAGTAKTATASTAPAEKQQWVQKVIDVKYGDVRTLAKLLSALRPGNTSVEPQVELHAIAIGTYVPSFIPVAEEIVKRYDVAQQKEPPQTQHDIELTAYILMASRQGKAGDALPEGLEGVVKQLHTVFGYRDLKLLDTALVRAREGRAGNMIGELFGLVEGTKAQTDYQMDFTVRQVRAEGKSNVIELSDFRFSFPTMTTGVTSPPHFGFKTDLSITEGQKVVVGKSSVGSAEQALILVLSARVVN